ncbi:hypothetical protein SpCBS45565_g01936 [Spizellomyces sp. 'palustris']|nr:hypothetical protein SpCBS45565_g01936 [Spizellomyces sp. 'palustris']
MNRTPKEILSAWTSDRFGSEPRRQSTNLSRQRLNINFCVALSPSFDPVTYTPRDELILKSQFLTVVTFPEETTVREVKSKALETWREVEHTDYERTVDPSRIRQLIFRNSDNSTVPENLLVAEAFDEREYVHVVAVVNHEDSYQDIVLKEGMKNGEPNPLKRAERPSAGKPVTIKRFRSNRSPSVESVSGDDLTPTVRATSSKGAPHNKRRRTEKSQDILLLDEQDNNTRTIPNGSNPETLAKKPSVVTLSSLPVENHSSDSPSKGRGTSVFRRINDAADEADAVAEDHASDASTEDARKEISESGRSAQSDVVDMDAEVAPETKATHQDEQPSDNGEDSDSGSETEAEAEKVGPDVKIDNNLAVVNETEVEESEEEDEEEDEVKGGEAEVSDEEEKEEMEANEEEAEDDEAEDEVGSKKADEDIDENGEGDEDRDEQLSRAISKSDANLPNLSGGGSVPQSNGALSDAQNEHDDDGEEDVHDVVPQSVVGVENVEDQNGYVDSRSPSQYRMPKPKHPPKLSPRRRKMLEAEKILEGAKKKGGVEDQRGLKFADKENIEKNKSMLGAPPSNSVDSPGSKGHTALVSPPASPRSRKRKGSPSDEESIEQSTANRNTATINGGNSDLPLMSNVTAPPESEQSDSEYEEPTFSQLFPKSQVESPTLLSQMPIPERIDDEFRPPGRNIFSAKESSVWRESADDRSSLTQSKHRKIQKPESRLSGISRPRTYNSLTEIAASQLSSSSQNLTGFNFTQNSTMSQSFLGSSNSASLDDEDEDEDEDEEEDAGNASSDSSSDSDSNDKGEENMAPSQPALRLAGQKKRRKRKSVFLELAADVDGPKARNPPKRVSAPLTQQTLQRSRSQSSNLFCSQPQPVTGLHPSSKSTRRKSKPITTDALRKSAMQPKITQSPEELARELDGLDNADVEERNIKQFAILIFIVFWLIYLLHVDEMKSDPPRQRNKLAQGILMQWAQIILDSLPSTGQWNDNHLHALAVVFSPSIAIAALNLLEREAVTRVDGPGGRNFYQVEDDRDFLTCFPFVPYCTCVGHREQEVVQLE